MDADLKKRKKRSRWGADLDDEEGVSIKSPIETSTTANEDQQHEGVETLKSTSGRRKKSRWGGDKSADDSYEQSAPAIGDAATTCEVAEKQVDDSLSDGSGVRSAPRQFADWQPAPQGAGSTPSVPRSGFGLTFEKSQQTTPGPSEPSEQAHQQHSTGPPAESLYAQADTATASTAQPSTAPTAPLVQTAHPTGLGDTLQPAGANAVAPEQLVGVANPTGVTDIVKPAQVVVEDVEMQVDSPKHPGAQESAAEIVDGEPSDLPTAPSEPPSSGEKALIGDAPVSDPANAPNQQSQGPASDGTPSTQVPSQGAAQRDRSKEPCSLVVKSIRPEANEQSMRLLFESAGKVVGCKLVMDPDTGKHRGFGFVMMASRAEAEAAAEKLHKLQWGELQLEVTLKIPEAKPPTSTPGGTPPPPWSTSPGSAPWAAGGTPPGSLPPPPGGLPSSLPIATAYSGYPPYDPYAAAYGYYGYGYDPYAAYAAHAAYTGMSNGIPGAPTDTTTQDDEKPPGVEDEEAPPGIDSIPVQAGEGPAADGLAGEVKAQTGEANATEAPAPPPPPPKKEPTVIHVPLKVPEGARKKQEERKKAREEKAKQQAEAVAAAAATPRNEEVVDEKSDVKPTPEKVAPVTLKPAPVVLGTKGSFQEVLARRQAELAALRGGKAGTAGRRGKETVQLPPPRADRRGRSISRSPPPPRRVIRRPISRSHSPDSRSPATRRGRRRSLNRRGSGSRSRSHSGAQPPHQDWHGPSVGAQSRSYSAVPTDLAAEGDQNGFTGRRSQSASPARRKDKHKSKERKREKRKHKKEKKQKVRDIDSAHPSDVLPVDIDEPAPPPKDSKPAAGWVEVPLEAPTKAAPEIVLPPPPEGNDVPLPKEPAVFRKPGRKRARTRWQPDAPELGDEDGEEAGESRRQEATALEPEERRREKRRSPRGSERKERRNEEEQTEEKREPSPIRKPSPQVSEEGEILVEEGEIEGELGELPIENEAPRSADQDWRGKHRDDHRNWNNYGHAEPVRYGSGRGRGGWAPRGRGWNHSGYSPDNGRQYHEQRWSEW